MNLTMGSVMNIARYLKSCGVDLPSSQKVKEEFFVTDYFDKGKQHLYGIRGLVYDDDSVAYRLKIEDCGSMENILISERISSDLEELLSEIKDKTGKRPNTMPRHKPNEELWERIERFETYKKGEVSGIESGIESAISSLASIVAGREFLETEEQQFARDPKQKERKERAKKYIEDAKYRLEEILMKLHRRW